MEGLQRAVQELRLRNARLERKLRRVEVEKATWELRCKWTWWLLEECRDPAARSVLAKVKSWRPDAGVPGGETTPGREAGGGRS